MGEETRDEVHDHEADDTDQRAGQPLGEPGRDLHCAGLVHHQHPGEDQHGARDGLQHDGVAAGALGHIGAEDAADPAEKDALDGGISENQGWADRLLEDDHQCEHETDQGCGQREPPQFAEEGGRAGRDQYCQRDAGLGDHIIDRHRPGGR